MLSAASAQELTVKSMAVAAGDLTASTQRRLDINQQPCALVKVQLPLPGAVFEGNIIQPVDYKTNEYWVYMTEGSKELHVKHPSYQTLVVAFPDYGVKSLQSLSTYRLSIGIPQSGTAAQTQKLIINYSPAKAMVLVDSKPYPGNGHLELVLPVGNHNYIIAANGYETVEGSVKLSVNVPRTITEHLVSMTQSSTLEVQETVIHQNSPSYREYMEEVKSRIAARVYNITVESYMTEGGEAYIKCTYDTGILFATGKSRLTSIGVSNLKQICDVLGEYLDKFDVAIDGYTDNSGRPKDNLDLSEKRANAVAAVISECNSAIRIKHVEGHGGANPVAENFTSEGRAQNRRVEIILHPSEAMLKAARNGTLNNQSTSTVKADPLDVLGAEISPLSESLKEELSISSGLYVVTKERGRLKEAGVPSKFIILKVNDTPIDDPDALRDVIKDIVSLKNNTKLQIHGLALTGKKLSYTIPL